MKLILRSMKNIKTVVCFKAIGKIVNSNTHIFVHIKINFKVVRQIGLTNNIL